MFGYTCGWTLQKSAEGKERAMEQRRMLSAQVMHVKKMVEDVDNDVMWMVLDYDGTGNAHVAGYSVQNTRS